MRNTPESMTDEMTAEATAPPATLWPLYVGAFLATYMFSVSNVAIPALKVSLGAGDSTSALVVGLFSAAFAAGLILCGRIGDRFGRRRLFTIGTAALVLASIGVGLAPDSFTLLITRTVQGLAAAAMMPQILASIQHALTGSRRLKAISLFGAFSGVGTVGGQVIGGTLISAFGPTWGWRAAFLSCGIVALAAFLGSLKLTESRSAAPGRLDLLGVVLLGIGMVCLVIGLALGPVTGWFPLPLTLLIAALASILAFAFWQSFAEAHGRDPLIPPSVVRLPAAWIGMLMSFVFFGGFGAFLYNYSLTTQVGHEDSAFISGITLGVFAASFLFVSLIVPRVVRKLSGPGTMLLGTAMQIVGLIGFAGVTQFADSGWNYWVQIPGVILGAGQALQFGPLVGTVVSVVPDRVAGLSGGLIATMQQAGIAMGVALLGALFHLFVLRFGYDSAFALTSLTQILLSIAFGIGAIVLLRLARR